MKRPHAIMLAAALAFAPVVGHAQPTDDASKAVELFREGRAALDAGDLDVACAKFEESEARDAQVGTLLNLALCEEKRHRLVRALEDWRSAVDLATQRNDDRSTVAQERATELDGRIPRLTIMLPPDAPPNTKVKVENHGVSRWLKPEEIGAALSFDPGELIIVMVSDAGEHKTVVQLAERDAKSVVLEGGGSGSSEPVGGGGDDGGGGPSALLLAGVVVGGLGLAGVAVGAGFGAMAKSKNDESNETVGGVAHCDGNDICDTDGLALRDDAIAAATVSTAAFVIGGAAVAAGLALVVVDLTFDDEGGATSLVLTPTGVSARWTW